MPEVRDLLMTAVSVDRIVSRHLNRRRNGIEFAGFRADLFKISQPAFFLSTDRRERQERLTTERFAHRMISTGLRVEIRSDLADFVLKEIREQLVS